MNRKCNTFLESFDYPFFTILLKTGGNAKMDLEGGLKEVEGS